MWISDKLAYILKFNLDEQIQIREDLAACRAKCEVLERSLAHTQSSFNWLAVRVNDLENQNKALLEKAFDIKVPAPQIAVKAPPIDEMLKQFSFDDVGDEVANKLGL